MVCLLRGSSPRRYCRFCRVKSIISPKRRISLAIQPSPHLCPFVSVVATQQADSLHITPPLCILHRFPQSPLNDSWCQWFPCLIQHIHAIHPVINEDGDVSRRGIWGIECVAAGLRDTTNTKESVMGEEGGGGGRMICKSFWTPRWMQAISPCVLIHIERSSSRAIR